MEKDHPWASRKPSKRALQFAFYTGAVTVSERNGMLKTYELMVRHFGWNSRRRQRRAARSPTICSTGAARAGHREPRFGLPSRCSAQAGDPTPDRGAGAPQRMVPVALEGAGKQEHWARPEAIEAAPAGDPQLVHILSPFDPLIIQRKRPALFFGYEPPLRSLCPEREAPARLFRAAGARRRRHRRGGRSEDRPRAQKLLMQKWTWVGNGTARRLERAKPQIEEALHRFERFQLAD